MLLYIYKKIDIHVVIKQIQAPLIMDKIETKIKIYLTKLSKKYSFHQVAFCEKIQVLNCYNSNQLFYLSFGFHQFLDILKKYLGINSHAFLGTILYFNTAFSFHLKNEKT